MDADIAILGTSNSGKTNFIAETIKDINSFSPRITINPINPVQNSEAGGWHNNQYILKVYEDVQWEFSICDYVGSLLQSHDDSRTELTDIFCAADAWIVLVDGTYFSDADEADEEIVRRIKHASVRTILPYISEYAERHGERSPELLFVVTKAQGLFNQFPPDRIKHIIMESYEGIFTEGSSPLILLSETASTKSAGLAVLALFYMKYEKLLSDNIFRLKSRNEEIEDDICRLRSSIYEIESHAVMAKLPGNKSKIQGYEREISSLKEQASENRQAIQEHEVDMGLKQLGTCVQCLIDNNPKLAVNGFDRIDYQYDKTKGILEDHSVIKAVLHLNLCILVVILIYLIFKAGFASILVRTVLVAALAIVANKVSVQIIRIFCGALSAIGLINLIILLGRERWGMVIGYAVFFALSMAVAVFLEKQREKFSEVRYLDEMVYFFDNKAKEAK